MRGEVRPCIAALHELRSRKRTRQPRTHTPSKTTAVIHTAASRKAAKRVALLPASSYPCAVVADYHFVALAVHVCRPAPLDPTHRFPSKDGENGRTLEHAQYIPA